MNGNIAGDDIIEALYRSTYAWVSDIVSCRPAPHTAESEDVTIEQF